MADGIRRIARALYDRAGEEERGEAEKLYEKLCVKEEKKVRLKGFKKGVDSELSNEKVFKELDSDNDGFLDFEDVLLLFYYSVKKAITIFACRGCLKPIFGPTYLCFECMFNSADRRFALCHDCHVKRKVKHPHPLTLTPTETAGDLSDNEVILLNFGDLVSRHPQESLTKNKLSQMWKEAKSYHNREASPAVEAMADNYFKSPGADLYFFSTLTEQQKAFLTPGPNTSPETASMLYAFAESLPSTSTSTLKTVTRHDHVNHSRLPPKRASSSDGTTFREMADEGIKLLGLVNTVASLVTMCTIM